MKQNKPGHSRTDTVVVSKTDVCAKCDTKTGGDFYCTSRDRQTLADKIVHKGKYKADKPV